ncbi:MAG: Maf family protein [bacterium]
MGNLYLASASPRRVELLRQVGLNPISAPSHVAETRRRGEGARDLVLRLARLKAASTAKLLTRRGARMGLVLGADTVVESGGRILGKPRGATQARSMLKSLAGRAHRVHTGVCLLNLGDAVQEVQTFVETTKVFFRDLSDREIADYVATGEPLDKAGAYGIQGAAGAFVRRIEGDYYAVVGLPLARVAEALKCVDIKSSLSAAFPRVVKRARI